MTLGFGNIGCGMIAHFHARAIADIRGAKLVGCFDQFPKASEAFGQQHDCPSFKTLEDFLNNPQLDVVTICTPSGAHCEPAVAAARAGKHVIVEKPLEITLKRCDEIIKACDENKVKLFTVFPSRYHESSRVLKSAVEKGKFGRMTLGDAYVKWFRTQEYYDSGAWRGTWKLDGGGALMNQAIHTVDLLDWLMGPVVEITAQVDLLAHKRIEVEDVVVATLRFASGALGVLEATTAAYPGALKRIELHGIEGSAVLEEEDIIGWEFAKMTKSDRRLVQNMGGATQTGGGASDPSAIGHHAHALLFKDAIKEIAGKPSRSILGIEGRRSVEIILAIYKAASSGKSVQLPLKRDPVLKYRKTGV
ncbi:MAG: Gfo/Idh/MocA family oxidoreductase [Planctomycetota bacterium]|nr:Gfo/Idh/MocA family oxidoreductase [Planctomycetota bacterium]